MDEFEEIEILSAKNDFAAFLDSMIWADLKRELEAWKIGFERELASIVDKSASENPSTATVLMHLGDINGRIKAVDYMLQLPQILMEMKEQDKEAKPKNEEDQQWVM